MMRMRTWILFLTSLLCYTYFLQWFVLLLLILAMATIFTDRISNLRQHKIASVFVVLLYISGFALFKGYSSAQTIAGYSVFAFSGISYVADQYRRKRDYSIPDVIVYLFFFPKMLAGPIVKAENFIPQLEETYKWSSRSLYKGFKVALYGCFLKFIIADILLGREQEMYGINVIMQSVIWGVRFYIDFYAYSILAVGVAMWLGIDLPYNFNNPYSATSFKAFWQRWNITLSIWLRDYIYIPLGGNRGSKLVSTFNVIATFIISGLWHGISMPFLLWGVCHGVLVSIERFVVKPQLCDNRIWMIMYRIIVVFTTMLLWELFRFRSCEDVGLYIHHLQEYAGIDMQVFTIFCIAIIALLLIDSRAMKSVVFQDGSSRRNIICEVTFLSIILVVLLFCPYKYTFNFFYFKF